MGAEAQAEEIRLQGKRPPGSKRPAHSCLGGFRVWGFWGLGLITVDPVWGSGCRGYVGIMGDDPQCRRIKWTGK